MAREAVRRAYSTTVYVLAAADQNADGWILPFHPLLRIECLQVELHLAFVLWFELADLQLHRHQ